MFCCFFQATKVEDAELDEGDEEEPEGEELGSGLPDERGPGGMYVREDSSESESEEEEDDGRYSPEPITEEEAKAEAKGAEIVPEEVDALVLEQKRAQVFLAPDLSS